MNIEHIGIIVNDLERMKDFYELFTEGKAGDKYINSKKNFQSYFIDFNEGSRLELMYYLTEDILKGEGEKSQTNHFAFQVLSPEEVENKVNDTEKYGGKIIENPRWSGLGDYVGTILDPEGNKLEILFRGKK